MQEVLLISNVKPEQKSLDFDFLREQGIENIQNLASKIWTDYNAHDPGITILEQLIYAITELGYKTNFDIKDIIAQNPENDKLIKTGLFTAPEILSNTPVHIDDFRKILIDVPGIRNAFLKIANGPEIPVFVDSVNHVASYTGTEQVSIRGLYSVILELDKDDEFGDLNSTIVDWSFYTVQTDELVEISTEVSFPDWMSVPQILRETIHPIGSSSFPRIKSIRYSTDVGFSLIERRTYATTLQVDIYTSSGVFRTIELPMSIVILDNIAKYDLSQIEENLKTTLNNNINYTEGEIPDPEPPSTIESLVLKYCKKIMRIWDIAYAAQAKLDSYRNLCEDFKEIANLKQEEVSLCLQIEVGPGADIEQIEAEIYFRVGNFLSPKVKFRTATELLAKGMTVDQIFEGPVLDHGFLDLKEVLTIDERKVLYVSDLIQIIMDIPGVISVADIHLSSYIDNVMMNDEVTDCLAPTFAESHRLRLSVQKSSVIFFRDDDPTDPQKVFLVASKKKVKERVRELEILENSLVIGNDPNEFDAPEGSYRDMEEYYSIQNNFPLSYGIGPAGLTSGLPKMRYAQAKQLKSYLLFSEQLLANLMSQLAHIKELFAIDPSLKKTYFTQHVDIPNVFPGGEENKYVPYTDVDNFLYSLQDMVEGKELYIERRNKVLDHLLARFSEDFTGYSLKLFEVFGTGTEERLIKDKLNFLNHLPVVSGERLRSYNYKDLGNTWSTENVPGYQKRVSLKLGIEDFRRKSLSFVYEEREEDIKRVFRLYEKVDGHAPVSAGSVSMDPAEEDGIDWTDLSGISQEGESSTPNEVHTDFMKDGQVSKYLYVQGFDTGFSFLESDAVIEGIKVEIVKRIDPGEEDSVNIDGDIEDLEIKLLRAGTIVGSNKAKLGEAWPSERRYFSYGGVADKWGTTWTADDIKDPEFGVAIKVKKTGDRERIANVDHVKITVFYTEGEIRYYFDTQPEFRAFGVSSALAGYTTEQERKDVLTEVVDYGYNFCNYCTKEPGQPYTIKKSLTDDDRKIMCDEDEDIESVNVVYSGEPGFDNKKAAADYSELIFSVFWDFEGMHVVEHLLLRPKINEKHFIDIEEDSIHNPDTGRLRYTVKRKISDGGGSLDYTNNKITLYEEDLTSFINVGKIVQVIDEYGNYTPYTVQEIVYNSPNTVIKTQEALERDGDPERLAYERTFPIKTFGVPANTITIGNQHLETQVEAIINDEGIPEDFVFEIYNSVYNNGIYKITDTENVTEVGADTRFLIEKIERPFSDDLLPISISDDDCTCPELKDNYSFRISVIMPEWPVRFTNGNFRKLAERILRYEAPAHVYVRLVWVDKPQMKAFEQKYQTWLFQNSKVIPDPDDQDTTDTYKTDLNSAHNEFVEKLFSLRNRFAGSIISDITSDSGSTGELSLLGQIYLG